jgi:hypothetical protein
MHSKGFALRGNRCAQRGNKLLITLNISVTFLNFISEWLRQGNFSLIDAYKKLYQALAYLLMIKLSNGLFPCMPLTLSQLLSIRKPVQHSTHILYTVGTVRILKEAWVTPGGNIWTTRNGPLVGPHKLPKFMLLGHIGQNFFGPRE